MMCAEILRRGLQGMRILLVEDNFLVATHLKRLLSTWGCEVVGPAPSVMEAAILAGSETFSGAILDINIIGGSSMSVAEALQQKGCPFFFITGYGSPQGLPDSLKAVTRLNKPIDASTLESTCLLEFRGN
jgi:DNA-binding NtrC family response regulator